MYVRGEFTQAWKFQKQWGSIGYRRHFGQRRKGGMGYYILELRMDDVQVVEEERGTQRYLAN